MCPLKQYNWNMWCVSLWEMMPDRIYVSNESEMSDDVSPSLRDCHKVNIENAMLLMFTDFFRML